MILAEPRGGRAEFLSEVCAQLGLRNVEIYAHKVGSDYPGRVSGVITRAVGTISQTLERVAACLAPGGRVIFMKGPHCDRDRGGRADGSGVFPACRRSSLSNPRHTSSTSPGDL